MKKPTKLNEKIVSYLEKRLADEFTASYFYRDASNYLQGIGFSLAAKYFAKESADELEHAKGIEKFLVDWNVHPSLPQIDAQENKFDSLPDVIESAYTLEYALYEAYEEDSVAIFKLGDICVFDFLQAYRTIQTKSVAEYSDMLNMLEGCDCESKFELLLLEEKLFGEG